MDSAENSPGCIVSVPNLTTSLTYSTNMFLAKYIVTKTDIFRLVFLIESHS